jgi:AcrR family transcriptional regulator
MSEREHTRARLLREARDLYLEVGVARFSLREVARRAAVSPAAVYRHYDGKEALLRDVCSQGFRTFASYLMHSLAAATPRERLVSCMHQYLRFGLEHSRDYRVIFMGAAQDIAALSPPPSTWATPHQLPETFQFLVDRVRECMDSGVLATGEASEVATQIWAHVHGLVSLRLSGHLDRVGTADAFEGLYQRSVHKLLAGLQN